MTYGTSGWPDIDGLIPAKITAFLTSFAIPYYIEAKMPGKKPTALQAKRLRELEAAGALTFVVDTWEQFEADCRAVLRKLIIERTDEHTDEIKIPPNRKPHRQRT